MEVEDELQDDVFFDGLDQVIAQFLFVGVVGPHGHVVREEVWLRISRGVYLKKCRRCTSLLYCMNQLG